MEAGLYWAADALRYSLTAAFTNTGVVSNTIATGGAGVQSFYMTDQALPLVSGVALEATTYSAGAATSTPGDHYEYTLIIDGVYTGSSSGASFKTSMDAQVVFNDLKLYWMGSFWRLTFTSFDWYVEGGIVHSGGASTLDSLWHTKAGVPLFGVQPRIFARADGFEDPLFSSPPPAGQPAFNVTGTAVADGGWDFQEPGSATWRSLPVTTRILPPLSIADCPAGVPGVPDASATTTADGHVEGYGNTTYDGLTPALLTRESQSAELYLADDCPASVKRIGSDYQAMWYRFGMPRTEHLQTASCVDNTE